MTPDDTDDVKTETEADDAEAEAEDPKAEAERRLHNRMVAAVLELAGYDGPDEDTWGGQAGTEIADELQAQFPDATTAELDAAMSNAADEFDSGIEKLEERIFEFREVSAALREGADVADGNDEEEGDE